MIIQYRNVADFHSVRFRGPGKLEVLQGDQEGVRIEAAGQFLDQIYTEVKQGRLSLGIRSGDIIDIAAYQASITYRVTVRDLRCLDVSHHATVTLPDLDSDELQIIAAGQANIEFRKLTADQLIVKASHRSMLKMSGDVEQQTVELSDQSKLQAVELISDNGDFRLTGHAVAEVRVNDVLSTYVGEFARLTYVGYPDVEKYGAGKMVRRRKPKLTTRGTEHG